MGEWKHTFRSKIEVFRPLLAKVLDNLSNHIVEKCSKDATYKNEMTQLSQKMQEYGDDAFIRFLFLSRLQELLDGVMNLFIDDLSSNTKEWMQSTMKNIVDPSARSFHYALLEGWKNNVLPLSSLIEEANPKFWKMVATSEWGPKIAEYKLYDLWVDPGVSTDDRKWAITLLVQLCEFSDISGYTTVESRTKIEKFIMTIIRDATNGKGFNLDFIMDQMQTICFDVLNNRDSIPDILDIFRKLIGVIMTFSKIFSSNNVIPAKFMQLVNAIQSNSSDKNTIIQECQKVLQTTDLSKEIEDPETSKLIQETMNQFGMSDIFDQIIGKPQDLL